MSSATNGDTQPAMIFDSLLYYDNELAQFSILKENVERELAREGTTANAAPKDATGTNTVCCSCATFA